jgi:hypothetical protein
VQKLKENRPYSAQPGKKLNNEADAPFSLSDCTKKTNQGIEP